jgi:hypothetical protein
LLHDCAGHYNFDQQRIRLLQPEDFRIRVDWERGWQKVSHRDLPCHKR